MKTVNNLARHGDLSFRRVNKAIKTKKEKTVKKIWKHIHANKFSEVLAYGETTGHKHVLVSNSPIVTYEEEGTKYFELADYGHLSHEEHDTITFEPGTYQVIREREYDYFLEESRRVLD